MNFTIRVYTSKQAGQSGKLPIESFNTGSLQLAEREAKEYSDFYGAAVVVDNYTGKRTWFEKK